MVAAKIFESGSGRRTGRAADASRSDGAGARGVAQWEIESRLHRRRRDGLERSPEFSATQTGASGGGVRRGLNQPGESREGGGRGGGLCGLGGVGGEGRGWDLVGEA